MKNRVKTGFCDIIYGKSHKIVDRTLTSFKDWTPLVLINLYNLN